MQTGGRSDPAGRQICRVVLTGRNVGADRYLPDGCGLVFEHVVVLMGLQKKYRPLPTDRLCTKNIIDFPQGAENKDILFFETEAGDDITEIIVKTPPNGQEHVIPVGRLI